MSSHDQIALNQSLQQVEDAASAFLGESPSLSDAIGFTSQLQTSVDRVVSKSVEDGTPLACQAGCSYCCHVKVEALEPEVFRIARFLKTLPQDGLAAFTERLEKHSELVKGVSIQAHRAPCPFLENNLCLIYPIRPSVCRKAHSLDVQPCKENAHTLPQNIVLISKAEALVQGTARAYRKAGLKMGQHELSTAVLKALETQGIESQWLSGSDVLAEDVST